MSRPQVIVIGAGVAGISAAVALTQQGVQVKLIEQRAILGGRAYSYQKPEAPLLDNGHHITLGCYHHYRKLLSVIGNLESITLQKQLRIPLRGWHEKELVDSEFSVASLPAPWHLLRGLLRFDDFSGSEKLLAAGFGLAIRKRAQYALTDMTVDDWLNQHRQPQKVCATLWWPICLGALNTKPSQASANLFAQVLYQAFFVSRDDSAIGLFSRSLSAAHGECAKLWLERHGCELFTSTTVATLRHSAEVIEGLVTNSGQEMRADYYISALPVARLSRLLPGFENFADLETSPIINAYLLYNRSPFTIPFACLLGTRWQWVFDASHLAPNLISLTISAADDWLEEGQEELANSAHAEMLGLFPESVPERPLKSWVIKERRATMKHTPNQETKRLEPKTSWRNFYLAGDWTKTDLPCTLEGASLSGWRAAELVVQAIRGKVGVNTEIRI